jgi:cytochrome P450
MDTDNSAHYTEDGYFIPPHAKPLSGQENIFVSTWKFMRNPLEGFGPLSYKQGIVSLKTGRLKIHVVSDPKGMNEVLIKNTAAFRKAPLNQRILKPATKEGLLSVHDEQWRRQRRGVAPMFQHRHMADLAPLITEVVNGFKAKLDSGNGKIELNTAMADLTFDVLAKALLGDPKGLDRDRLKVATRKVVTSAGTLRPDDLMMLPDRVPRFMGPMGYRALRMLRKAADNLLASRDPENPGDDLVGLLISARDPKTGASLSPREQTDNLIGFFIAGHETTALTLTWALYLVGKHKPTEMRIVEEVKAVAGEGDVTVEHLGKMPFTRAVLDETMRLFPPAPLLAREAIADCVVGGRDIEPGDIVVLGTYIMHRTDRLWDKPNVFDPDRFIREPGLNRGKDKFMPFGAGPRVCVGAAFAVMESMMALATLVRDYEITPDADSYPRPLMTVTLRPQGGIPATVEKRH